MRVRNVFAVAAAACLVGAGVYLSPGAWGKVQQVLSAQHTVQPGKARSTNRQGQDGVAIVAATAKTADFPILRYAIGSISSPAVVAISTRVSSQIASIAVKDGQMVKAGDLLFTLDDRALKAQRDKDQATLAKDQALLLGAQQDLVRARDLAAKQAGTQQTYDQALATQKADEATVQADQATIDADDVQLSYTRIAAPISGRLGAVNVSVGDLVTSSTGSSSATPMVTITQVDPLRVSFSLPQSDLPLLQKAIRAPGSATVTLRNDGDPNPVGSGKLDFLDSSVDSTSGTILARATVPNKDLALWPGQYVNVALDAGTMPNMVYVPTVAVQPSQKGPFVYVVKPDNTVEFRPVEVALTTGQNSALSKGLKSGERVVVEGQLRLKDGAAVREPKTREPKATDNPGQPAPKVAEGQPPVEGATQP
ncbi:efflux RND transporter periplasmic adaptor subunit [Phyllobacterium salinisoli]|uniref:Efflux RND transporter periplasmic adaptor subunit n=1 Tax=Phyllobacterium salinisoli TaxID=1899321 RepID=A0A368K9B3_9HYPH|nr:efflux RND transporter periplasmic adaptor subunit [Phyllobacterium salinisoli]RCS25937.1 efflux RND transporter periplasmic adaptor subunit [Phyllobacterium salinisoli]